MLTASTLSLHEFPPLHGLKQFFYVNLLFLHLSGGARKMKKKQINIKEDERRRREHAEAMSVRHVLSSDESR